MISLLLLQKLTGCYVDRNTNGKEIQIKKKFNNNLINERGPTFLKSLKSEISQKLLGIAHFAT